MPKDTGDDCGGTRYTATNQGGLKTLASQLRVDNKGADAQEIEIMFHTADQQDESRRAEMIEKVLALTPNLTKLTLNFSGWLYKPSDCLGDKLLETMCKLTKLEHFENRQTAGTRIDFGLYELRKLVSSWTSLRTIHLAGDTGTSRDCSQVPPATCALESVTFERCMSRYEDMAPMFAGSANSLKSLEIWVMGSGALDLILRPILPGIEDITFGGYQYPTLDFLKNELAKAPKLRLLSFRGEITNDTVRLALEEALQIEGNYPSLEYLLYPARHGTCKTGRGRNVREHEYENPGEEELLEICKKRDIRAEGPVFGPLKYEVEGAQRRAGFAAMARRGWW